MCIDWNTTKAPIMIELALTVQLALPQVLEGLPAGGELLASNKPKH